MDQKEKEKLIRTLKNNDINGYIDFLKDNLPQKLYRYCAHTNQNIDLILSGKIKLNNPSKFNDPFDSLIHIVKSVERHYYEKIDRTIQKILYSSDKKICQLKDNLLHRDILNSSIGYKTKFSILKEEQKKLLNPSDSIEDIKLRGILWEMEQFSGFANRYIGDFVSDSGVSCFSEKKNDVVMLSHYGKCHTGFCIEYRTDEIIHDVLNGEYFIVPIFYSDKIYQDYYESISEERLTPLWNLPQFMYKELNWEYEQEWRIIKFSIPETEQTALSFDYIQQIFLGTEFSNINKYILQENGNSEREQISHLVRLFEYCRDKKINIVPLRVSSQKYELESYYLM